MARKQKANKQTQGPGEDRPDRRREKESGKALVKKWPRIVLKSAIEIAANVKANALVVGVDALSDQDILKDVAKRTKVILVARNKMTFEQASEVAKNVLLMKSHSALLTRMFASSRPSNSGSDHSLMCRAARARALDEMPWSMK